MNVLAKLDSATRMLAQVRSASDAKQVMDIASAAEHYARKHKLGEEAVGHAHAIKIDAQAMLGQFVAKDPRIHRGGDQSEQSRTERLCLPDLGLTKDESANAQLLAKLRDKRPEQFEQIKAQQKAIVQVKRELKEEQREERREENRQRIRDTPPAESLIGAKFATITLDPPWDFGDEGDVDQFGRGRPTYHQMPIDEIAALPVAELSDIDCHLYLWITNRSLPKGFGLIEQWGFRYITCLTWCKPSFGMGNYFRNATEHILFAVKGSQPLKRKDAWTWFQAPRREKAHGSKPIAFYELVESCSPGPFLEMFSRCSREGWTLWGADAE